MGRNEQFDRVYAVVARIPHGRVVTYGQIAQHLGWQHGARTVGWAMRQCPEGLPWHRVVGTAPGSVPRGKVSSRASEGGPPLQRLLLEEEGIRFDLSGRIGLLDFGWDEI